MVSDRDMIRAFMARLIEEAGGVDATSALVSARLGRNVCKGTISKRMSGDLDWPLVEIRALEKVVGNFCVSRWIAGDVPEVAQAQSLMTAAALAVREHGEAIAATLAVASGSGDMAVALCEMDEALQALGRLRASLGATP
jgi:hypothetical protein